MKRVAIIHTVKSVLNSFEGDLKAALEEDIKVNNLMDEFLASDPAEVGQFTIDNRNRLLMDIKTQELTGADIIVTTCSTLTPAVEMVRPFIKVPVIAIDDAMARKGVTFGKKIFIMATAQSTVEPTIRNLNNQAEKAGVEIEISKEVYDDAYTAVKVLDIEKHDNILREAAKKIKGYDCIILAQASMAHMENEISEICNCPVLSSPSLCIEEIKEALNKINK